MADDEGADRKYVIAQMPYDPETTVLRVEVVIGVDGSGGVAASFLQDREPPPGNREARAALLRQAAEMVLEAAEDATRPRPGPPPDDEEGGGGVRVPRAPIAPVDGPGEALAVPDDEERLAAT